MMHARCLVPRAFQLTKHKPSDWAPVRLSFLASHSDHNEELKRTKQALASFLSSFILIVFSLCGWSHLLDLVDFTQFYRLMCPRTQFRTFINIRKAFPGKVAE
jgi:hypothetical protein